MFSLLPVEVLLKISINSSLRFCRKRTKISFYLDLLSKIKLDNYLT